MIYFLLHNLSTQFPGFVSISNSMAYFCIINNKYLDNDKVYVINNDDNIEDKTFLTKKKEISSKQT